MNRLATELEKAIIERNAKLDFTDAQLALYGTWESIDIHGYVRFTDGRRIHLSEVKRMLTMLR